jgi:hypothetical protein
MSTISNVKIEPMVVTWGEDIAQVQKITTGADVSSSLNNKYFFIYSATGSFYVWLNIGGAGVDPNPAGDHVAIPATAAANATASAIATAVQTALDGHADFVATVSGNVVTVTNAAVGYASQAHDGNSGFVFNLVTQGFTGYEIGCVEGDIELSVSQDLEPITCHETGTSVRGHIEKGKTVEATVTFKETHKANIKKLLTQAGGSYLPAVANSTEIAGWGTAKQFQNTFAMAMKLSLHPKRLPTGDKSEDFVFWKAYGQLESLNFSGESIMNIPVTFHVYADEAKHPAVQYFAYGDTTGL